ncbi:MAG: CidA/LrgA family protein [Desulfuromonas sp.]|nr:MAG: CidA/LrgA family protein [Desulfuromonas sp.]
MLKGFAILLMVQFAGELLVSWAGIPIPGNVAGMVILLLSLLAGIFKVEWIEEAADLLLSHLALFFVPAGVGVMVYFDLIASQWLPICVSMVISTFVVMAVTGWVEEKLERGERTDVE